MLHEERYLTAVVRKTFNNIQKTGNMKYVIDTVAV